MPSRLVFIERFPPNSSLADLDLNIFNQQVMDLLPKTDSCSSLHNNTPH